MSATFNRTLVGALLAVAAFTASAQSMSPVGLWKTIDDDGKTEKSLVRIVDKGGVLLGTVEKIFEADKQDAKCDKCSDDRKDKPILGLQIIRGVKQDVNDKAIWSGGEILDPNNGKTYRTRLRLIDGDRKLEMRGYLAFFYRTQVWQRVE
jgi:uncharacterized protein (DUF2147 family)